MATTRSIDTASSVEQLISGDANPAYAAFHRPRFTFLLEVLRDCGITGAPRILDIGVSQLTSLIATQLGARVETMGLESGADAKDRSHHQFDLNALQDRAQWRPGIGPYDVIVFAEVIEHLYTAPEIVLPRLRELLAPGGVLLIQTPNAVSLRKRAKMLLGVNPFERIRAERDNPGHFREYTASELKEVVTRAGFSVDGVWMKHYFDVRYARHERGDEPPQPVAGALKNAFYRLLPASLREGITMLARKI